MICKTCWTLCRAVARTPLVILQKRAWHLAVAALLMASGAAYATPVTCVGTVMDTYSPGITTTAQVVNRTTTSNYTSCVELLPLWSGTAQGLSVFSSSISCDELDLPGGMPIGNKTVTWSDGETSVWNGPAPTFTRLDSTTVIVRQSTVSSGRYLGKSVTETLVYLNTDLDACLSTGLTQLSGTATLLIE